MPTSVPPYNPREDGDKDQEEFWAGKPSMDKLVDNLAPLMGSTAGTESVSSKLQSLPDSIKSSRFSMALAEELLDKHPNMSAEKLEEILRGA